MTILYILAGSIAILVSLITAILLMSFLNDRKRKSKADQQVYRMKAWISAHIGDTGHSGSVSSEASVGPGADDDRIIPSGKAGGVSVTALNGPLQGRSMELCNNSLSFGRNPECSFSFPVDTPGISRLHAALSVREGKMVLTDCGSRNGTFIYTRGRLETGGSAVVIPGDKFCLGSEDYTFLLAPVEEGRVRNV